MCILDPEEASNFIENELKGENESLESEESEASQAQGRKVVVWTSKKLTGLDHEATQYFLQLRASYSKKFEDKKTIKRQLYGMIAKKNVVGYYVGEGREAIEKCRMKFANMQKQYLQYIGHMKTTGAEHKEKSLLPILTRCMKF